MKFVGLMISCFCIATVLSEVIGLGLVWSRGNLNMQTLQEIRTLLLVGEQSENVDVDEKETPQVTLDDVVNARARISAEFNSRDAELTVFHDMTTIGAERLTKQQTAFDKRKKAFDDELKTLKETLASEATERARGVLLAGKPKDAVPYLMGLPLEENVILLKGMPEKAIAGILKEFRGDEKETTRGQEIFEALSRGQPENSILSQAQADLQNPDDPDNR